MTDALWARLREGHDKSEIQQIQIELPEELGQPEKLLLALGFRLLFVWVA